MKTGMITHKDCNGDGCLGCNGTGYLKVDCPLCLVPLDVHGTCCGWQNAKTKISQSGIIIDERHPAFGQTINAANFGKFTLLKETPTIATDNTLPPSSPTATAEEILKNNLIKSAPEDWDTEQYEAYKKENMDVFDCMMAAMTEYASLKEQEARRQAIQECIDSIQWEGPTIDSIKKELEKLKK